MKRLALGTLLFLAGCNLAPHYQRPETGLPSSFRFETNELATDANVKWWESFHDEALSTLITKALENNKDLKIAIFRVDEYYGKYFVDRSPLFPEVDLKADSLRERFSPENGLAIPGFSPTFSDFSMYLTLSYEIDFWGSLRNQAKAGYEAYLQNVEDRKTVVLTLVSAVAQSYMHLRTLDLEYTISQETLDSRRDSLRIARARFEGGLTSELEVAQAQSLFEEALAKVKELERQIPQEENLLSVLLGENPGPILRGKTIDTFLIPLEIPSGLPSDLLKDRPDIMAAEHRLIQANANIGVARAAFLPTINLSNFFGTDSKQLRHLFSKEAQIWEIGGNLFQTIFAGGKLVGQLKATKALQQEALFSYEQTILTALKEVSDALIGHQKAKEIVLVQEANVAALQDYLNLSWLRYYEGQTQYLTVLDAERSLFAGQIDLAKALESRLQTLISLYKALGGGWVEEADLLATEK